MHRFLVPTNVLNGDSVRLDGETAQQIRRVLRMREGDEITLFSGGEYEYNVRLTGFGKETVFGEVMERSPITTEPQVQLSLYLALLNKSEKFELALQKCTEVGVSRFVPLVAERSIGGSVGGGHAKRERWERIIREAVEQSGRGRIPALEEPVSLQKALTEPPLRAKGDTTHIALIATPAATTSLRRALTSRPGVVSAGLFIGPEGGFSAQEIQAADEAGVIPVSIGPRILRAETAAVAVCAMLLYELGEMGSS